MQRLSTSEFIFIAIRASSPASLAAIVRSISSMIPSRMWAGASSTLRDPARPGEPGELVEHVGDVGADLVVAGEEPEVRVEPRRLGVVVAGADVHVVADAVALAAHDEDRSSRAS